MLFSEDFLDTIADDASAAALKICTIVLQEIDKSPGDWRQRDYNTLLEGVALLQAMADAKLLEEVVAFPPPPTGQIEVDCKRMNSYVRNLAEILQAKDRISGLEKMKASFSRKLKGGFGYEFSEGDLARIQTLINELRDQVSTSTLFEEKHQARLLKRLERLQAELHKRVSDLDGFWGMIGDAGVALGRFGTAAKPLVDRIGEITQIVWNTQKQAEGLPSSMEMPLLSHSEQRNPPHNTENTGL